MNQYPRYPGDYLKKTLGLSMLEDGAYTRLLDAYYAEERGIEHERRYAIARAMTDDEKKAVDYILGRYFKLIDGSYEHDKAQEVIEAVHKRVAANRENGAKGGRPRLKEKPNRNPTVNPKANPNESLQSQSQSNTEIPPLPPDAGEVAGGGSLASQSPEEGHQPTPAGLVCQALKAAGIADTNPGHPKLAALLEVGATVEEIAGFAPAAIKAGTGFAWILTAAINERTRAAQAAKGMQKGPKDAKPWYETRKGIEDMGERLEIGRWDAEAYDLGRGEMFATYERRVRKAAKERGIEA